LSGAAGGSRLICRTSRFPESLQQGIAALLGHRDSPPGKSLHELVHSQAVSLGLRDAHVSLELSGPGQDSPTCSHAVAVLLHVDNSVDKSVDELVENSGIKNSAD
jgi:hypothetical protein